MAAQGLESSKVPQPMNFCKRNASPRSSKSLTQLAKYIQAIWTQRQTSKPAPKQPKSLLPLPHLRFLLKSPLP